jgi:uncharacterized membrane protein YfcA
VTGLLLAAAAGIVAGAALQAATGFGFSLLGAPLLFAAIPPAEAVGLLILLGTEVNLLTLATERRRPQPLIRNAAVLCAWAVPGSLAGVIVLRALPPVALQVAVTLGVAGTLAARRLAGHRAHVPAWAAGLTSGALTTSTSISGPPLLLHLMGRDLPPARVRDTLTTCFLALGAIAAVALWASGTHAVPDATLAAALIPAVAVAHLIGRRGFAHLQAADRYEPILTGLLLVAVLAGLVGVLA